MYSLKTLIGVAYFFGNWEAMFIRRFCFFFEISIRLGKLIDNDSEKVKSKITFVKYRNRSQSIFWPKQQQC